MTGVPRRRIALVTSSYAPHIGGVEQHASAVAAELRSRGHKVEVWTVDRGEHLGVSDHDGTTTRYLPTPLPAFSPAGVISFVRAALPALSAWRAAYLEFRPEILHVQCFGPNGVYAELLGRSTGTPRVISSHGETLADDHAVFDRSWVLTTFLRTAVRAGAVTGCSPMVAADLRARFGAAEVQVVPNGVDLSALPGRGAARRTRHVLGVGRLEHNKGFDLLLDAVALLPEDVTAELVGSGSQEASLREKACRLGLETRLSISGRASHGEVLRRIASSGVVCVPSRVESFGMVVLEAWACGTPVVATSLSGPATFVHDGVDGLLVDPGNARALAAALTEAMNPDTSRRLARAGREAVLGYTWARTVELYENLYDRVRGHGRGRGR